MNNIEPVKLSVGDFIKSLSLLLALPCGWFLVSNTSFGLALQDQVWIQQNINDSGHWGSMLFIVLGGLLTAFGLSRLLLSAAGGLVFGVELGVFFSMAASLLGCAAGFYYARLLGRKSVRRYFSHRFQSLERQLLAKPVLFSILLRNLPVGNNSLMNMIAGISTINPVHFFTGSCIGYLPLTLVFALMGQGIQQAEIAQIAVSVVLFAASIGASSYVILSMSRHNASDDNS